MNIFPRSRERLILPLSLLITVVLLFIPGLGRLCAQTQNGTITGTVQDAAGSVLVSAKVTVDPSGRQTASDEQGQFRIASLPAGTYTITVSYVGFSNFTSTVTVPSGQTVAVNPKMNVASGADTILVTAARLQGEAEAINIERLSSQIVQVLPEKVITSLPNTNIADAVGRVPSVSLERDEGEGKYVQIRGTEPRLSNVTINGVNVPAPEVINRNIKLDAVPSDIVERIEVYKTLTPDQDGDGIGGTVNLVTKTAVEKPTYILSEQTGYNPIQNGFWRGGFDGTFGQRFGTNKNLGFLLGGTWDRTNRGIDDLEPSPTFGTDPSTGKNVTYFSTADLRSYDYYRTRYGFDTGIDYKFTPTTTAYVKGLYADFHDNGDTRVYTPTVGTLKSSNGNSLTFDGPADCSAADQAAGNCSVGGYAYRHYVRRPDQQVFSILTGVRQEFAKDEIVYEFAGSRGHNIGGQDFPTTDFVAQDPSGNALQVPFTQDISNPYRPKFNATDGSNIFASGQQYGVVDTSYRRYHATQLNYQGNVSLAHNFLLASKPNTFTIGVKFRNSASTQSENDQFYNVTGNSPFTIADVSGQYTNPTYYNGSFTNSGRAYGQTTDYRRIQAAFAANSGAFALDPVNSFTRSQRAFFDANERVSAGFVEDVVFIGKLRVQGGFRFEDTRTHFLTDQLIANVGSPIPTVVPTRQDTGYFNVLPSVQAQYQIQKDTNIRASYGRGVSRPNIGDLVPTQSIDPNASPRTISTGNPNLQPTKANNYDVLIEHYFQPLGLFQAGYFYKQLTDPIFPTTIQVSLPQFPGAPFYSNQSINGPNAHIQGFETQYEQRLSFLPGVLNGVGVSANYSYTQSQVTFPTGFNAPAPGLPGRADKPSLQRQAPNTWNFNLTYDKSRFSSRFAISHNDANIAAFQWSPATGPADDPILGLRGPTGDNYFYAHTQYDVQGSYRTYKGIQVVVSGLNLSNEVFGFYNGSKQYPVQREYYRPTLSFGLRWVKGQEQ